MTKLFAATVLLAIGGLVANAGGDAPKVNGSWLGTAGNSEGKQIPEDIVAKIMLVVTLKDGKYSVTVMGKEVEAGTYKLNTKKKPFHLDSTPSKGKDAGKVQLGLLKVEGDVMTVAFAKAGSKDRPKNFKGGEGIEVTVLKRK
jgi:uncharacterized protein (TIGR03067 family)